MAANSAIGPSTGSGTFAFEWQATKASKNNPMTIGFAFMPANLRKLLQNYIKDVLLSHQLNAISMKRSSLFLALTAFALSLFMALPGTAQIAKVRPKHVGNQHGSITLTVASPRNLNYRFWLYVDDVLQNEEPVRSICITNLWEDDFYIRVELDNPLQNCVGQFVDLKQSQVLAIVQANKLFGLEPTQAHIRPELTMDLITGQPFVGGDNQPPMPPGPPMSFGMNPQDYEEACQVISEESFDSSKLTLAKQVVSANPMTASQILGICQLLSFESNKLEFAKFAYSYCVDPNKYYLLNEAFSYESSKRELNNFINGL